MISHLNPNSDGIVPVKKGKEGSESLLWLLSAVAGVTEDQVDAISGTTAVAVAAEAVVSITVAADAV